MKKFAVILFAAAVVLAFALPASAVEHQLGGYFRFVAASYNNLDGQDNVENTSGSGDLNLADSRTRINYTAKFSDDFKFVNSFEMDWTYGGPTGGDIGTDGKIVELARSYIDFNYWKDYNFKIGLIPYVFGRGTILDENFAGIQASYVQPGRKLIVPLVWIKAYEGGIGNNANDFDVDFIGLNPVWETGNWIINPFGLVGYSDDASAWGSTSAWNDFIMWWVGANIDYKFKNGSVWGMIAYEGGEVDNATTQVTSDISAWSFIIGGDTNIGPVNLSGQFNFFSGDDDATDNDINAWTVPDGLQGYNNTSELLGKGFLFSQQPTKGIWDTPTNVWMIGGAAKYNIVKSVQIQGDIWYSELAEGAEKALGTEVDLKLTWKLANKLKFEAVGAYLFAGNGFYNGANEADPWELGCQLSLSF
jgi:hypothetical protein